jgi:outer membrane protein assembly factor BamB
MLCVSTEDGATRWQRDCRLSANRKHELNSFASSTPVVDEGRVYVTFADEEELLVQALDHDGEHAWRSVFPGFKGRHGHAASPITHGNRLFVANEAQEASFVLALDKDTGKVVWKSPRRSDRGAYGTPCVVTAPEGGAELILTSKGHGISSLDLETGALRWEAPLFDKRSVSSPVIYKDLVIGTCGSGAGGNYLAAVRRGGSGDVSETHLAYKLSRSIPYVPTALVYDDLLFLWSDKGVVTCVKAATGDTVWMNRVEGRYFGSPVCVDGKLYCMSADGEVVVVRAADSFELLARNELGEPSHSTPAIAGGRMYLRTERHLSSVGGRRAQP